MTSFQTAVRYHDIDCGHRVVGHEGKCRHLHGHGYRIHFYAQAKQLDSIGRVIDFGVIKSKLCVWLEDNWDHKLLLWERDPLLSMFATIQSPKSTSEDKAEEDFEKSIVLVPFNPTAENIADHLLTVIGPQQLPAGIKLTKVIVEETRKCSAVSELG